MRTLGMVMVFISTMMADNESLVLPTVMMVIGAILMLKGGLER